VCIFVKCQPKPIMTELKSWMASGGIWRWAMGYSGLWYIGLGCWDAREAG